MSGDTDLGVKIRGCVTLQQSKGNWCKERNFGLNYCL